MLRRKNIALFLCCELIAAALFGQDITKTGLKKRENSNAKTAIQFIATTNLLDAAVSSVNSINSIIKKENYRNKINSFNNPATSDMGFSLESEITLALKPILDKTRKVNTSKFSEIVAALIHNPIRNLLPANVFSVSTVFNPLLSIVGNLAVSEKNITRADVDSFVLNIGKYFAQYEKLKEANLSFDTEMDKFGMKTRELEFDIRAFVLDIITILYADIDRMALSKKSLEELILQYLDKDILDKRFENEKRMALQFSMHYPGDGIKTAKEIVYSMEKLFAEYQDLYYQNYSRIRNVLLETKELGKNINTRQVENSIMEFDQLYKESKEADVLHLRLTTLTERLRALVNTEK